MNRKGQMTLEIVIMLLIVINIYAFISKPLSDVSMAASRSIGTAAMAMKAVDSMANKVNFVGISGDGAKGNIEVDISRDFLEMDCGNQIKVRFNLSESTTVVNPEGFGIGPALEDGTDTYSARNQDFNLGGECPNLDLYTDPESGRRIDLTLCLTFENNGGAVSITKIEQEKCP